MNQKWIYPLLLLFVVFFILSNPEGAGPAARNFFGWLGDQAAAAGTFFDGLFGDDDPAITPQGTTDDGTTNFETGDGFDTLPPLEFTVAL